MYGQQETTWVFHALSTLRKAFGYDWQQFNDLAQKYGILNFLYSNYELLHYYDNDYLVNDTLRYLKEQGGTIDALSVIG